MLLHELYHGKYIILQIRRIAEQNEERVIQRITKDFVVIQLYRQVNIYRPLLLETYDGTLTSFYWQENIIVLNNKSLHQNSPRLDTDTCNAHRMLILFTN